MSATDNMRRRNPFALSSWPLRSKLVLTIAIPLLLAGVLGGLRVQEARDLARNYEATANQVTVIGPAIDYLVAAERAMVAADNREGEFSGYPAALGQLEAAATELDSVRQESSLTDRQDHQVVVILDLSRALRESNESLSPDTWVALVRQMQSGVNQLVSTIVDEQIEPEPKLELLVQALNGRFALSMQQALVTRDQSGDTARLELFSELGAESSAIDRLASSLGATEKRVSDLRTENAQRVRSVRVNKPDLGGRAAYFPYDELIGSLQEEVSAGLDKSAADARSQAANGLALTLGSLLAAILLAFIVSRTVTRPLRRVRAAALKVAHEQLPATVASVRSGGDPIAYEPIGIRTREEVGQLASAVDDLHQQAVTLASAEAGLRTQIGDMFLTLSRRSNSLVSQQLRLIELLERDEEDPKRLESLFRLDHLASRMRRTAESLLILADAQPQLDGGEQITVSEALHAATSGVQEYQRARVRGVCSAQLRPNVAADVIHLLTELVDNALNYSEPNTLVTLTPIERGADVRIEILDHGLGIAPQALMEVNQQLARGGEVNADTARRMGLFVVARLAQRYGIKVWLESDTRRGTTAVVHLPSAILQAGSPQLPVGPGANRAALPSAPLPPPSQEVAAASESAAPPASRLPQRRPAEAGGNWFVASVGDEPPAGGDALSLRRRGNSPVPQPDPEPPAGRLQGTPVVEASQESLQEPAYDTGTGQIPAYDTGTGQIPAYDTGTGQIPAYDTGQLPAFADESDAERDRLARWDAEEIDHEGFAPPTVVEPVSSQPAPPPAVPLTVEPVVAEPATAEPVAEVTVAAEEVLDEPEGYDQLSEEPENLRAVADEVTPTEPEELLPGVMPDAEDYATEVEQTPLATELTHEFEKVQVGEVDAEPIEPVEPVMHAESDPDPVVESEQDEEPDSNWIETDEFAEALAAEYHDDSLHGAVATVDEPEAPVEMVEDSRDDLAADPESDYDLDTGSRAAAEVEASVAEVDVPAEAEAESEAQILGEEESEVDQGAPTEQPAEPFVPPNGRPPSEATPIFANLESRWFEPATTAEAWSPADADEGWQIAASAAAVNQGPTTTSGLPTRRPGSRLVPGGISAPAAPVTRDPAQLRQRLAAHLEGVRRGRKERAVGSTEGEEK